MVTGNIILFLQYAFHATSGIAEQVLPFVSKVGKSVSKYEMSSSLINSANAPVAKDNRHLNFGRFVKLDQP